jgi:hypothetical protein
MNLEAISDFVRLYYLKCGEFKTKKEAYEACEEAYYNQHKIHIDKGLMKPNRFSSFDVFLNSLSSWFKDPRNRKRIEI